jgi:hypothetical protein
MPMCSGRTPALASLCEWDIAAFASPASSALSSTKKIWQLSPFCLIRTLALVHELVFMKAGAAC